MKRVIFFLSALIIPLSSYSQYRINGSVRDDKGNALAGANIFIENTFYGTITDLSGKFVISKVHAGEKIIKASYVGYSPRIISAVISRDTVIDFILEPAAVMGEEVIVRAARAGSLDPIAFTEVSREYIEEKNAGRDIPYLLSLTPSIVTTSDAGAGVGYTGFRIRGTDANRINITVNGIPINDSESHGVWFVNMPDFATSVDNIQIQRGVGTSTNGAGAFGASLNFKTLGLSTEPYAVIDNSAGSFKTLRNSVMFGTGSINDKFTFEGRLSGIRSDGYIDRAESDMKSWFVSGGWHTDKNILKLNVFSGTEKTYQAWDGVPSYMLDSLRTYNGIGRYTDENGHTKYYGNETDNYKQDHYQLHYSHRFNNSVNFSGALHLTRGLGYYEQYREDEDMVSYGIPDIIIPGDTSISSTDLIRRKYLDNYFYGTVLSMNVSRQKYDLVFGGGLNRYIGDHYGTVIWARYAGTSEINHEWYNNNSLKTDYNIYSRINYRLVNSLNLYTDLQVRGIRYDLKGFDDDLREITQDHSFLFFNPKFGINYTITNNYRAFFSFSVANREPNRDNYTDASPSDPEPGHETLYDYEAGFDAKYNSFRAGVNLYYMDYNNQLVLTGAINDVGSPVMKNVKDSYRAGIELLAGAKLFEKVTWDFNVTLSSNRIKNFLTYIDNWNYWDDPENQQQQISEDIGDTHISFSPSLVAGNSINAELFRNLNVSLMSKYVGKQFIDNTSSPDRMLDAWFVNDLSASYTIKTRKAGEVTLSLLVANLFNHEYESNAWVYRYIYNGAEGKIDGYFPQAGINVLAGIKIRF